ncbi:MAG: hypothetical protein RR359_02315 [Bacilli bacterium]
MKDLEKEQLEELEGGALSIWAIGGIIALGIFIIGIVDGFVRPLRCNN